MAAGNKTSHVWLNSKTMKSSHFRLVVLVITRGLRSGMIRGWLITAEGHTTAREKGIMAMECRR